MMRRLDVVIVAGLFVLLMGFAMMMSVTSDRWVRLNSLTVDSGRVGQNLGVSYDREFLRPFAGSWRVELWRSNQGTFEAHCSAHGAWNYEPSRPALRRDWRWLVNNADCTPDVPGWFFARVFITIHPGSMMSRTARVDSPPFQVLP